MYMASFSRMPTDDNTLSVATGSIEDIRAPKRVASRAGMGVAVAFVATNSIPPVSNALTTVPTTAKVTTGTTFRPRLALSMAKVA